MFHVSTGIELIFQGMGTKIQANGFLRDYRSVIDLDGRVGNGMRPVYQENRAGENGIHPGLRASSGLGCDMEKARQMILEQELTFRNQLQELHRLYRRQKELMDEIKRREAYKAATNEEKPLQLSFLASRDSKKAWNAPYSSALQFPTLPEGKVVPNFAYSQDARILSSCERRLSMSSACLKEPYDLRIQNDGPNRGDKWMQDRLLKFSSVDRDAARLSLSTVQALQGNNDVLTLDFRMGDTGIANQKNGIRDGLVLSSDVFANSTLNLKTNDFFPNTKVRRNGINPLEGFENNQSRKEHPCNGCTGGSCSDKLLAFHHSPLAEQNKDLTQRTRKLFGIELEGCNDDSPLDASSTLELKAGSSSWIDKSFAQNLSLGRMDSNGKAEKFKADIKGKSSCPSGNSLQGCSAVRSSLDNVAIQLPEHFQKFRCAVPTTHTEHPHCRNGMENRQSELPWFLRKKQDRGDFSKGTTMGSYFMNLDSLQSCSQNFLRKTETADGAVPEAVQLNEESLSEGGADQLKISTSANKILGIPIHDMIHTSENPNSKNVNCPDGDVDCARKADAEDASQSHQGDSKNQDSQKVLDEDKFKVRHGIDLNLLLDEEALPSPPHRATTEIDLHPSAVTESSSTSKDYDDKIAAEGLLSIASSHRSTSKAANTSRLKWFAEIVSSQCSITIPDGIDQFEYMTLQLEESKEEQYHGREPYVSKNNQSEDESKRPRRVVLRRGRVRKDFQRDILPGITTLSRLEVMEDFQAFEELMRSEGGLRHTSSGRNARGRKRSMATQQRQPISQIQARSLTGWGKRTRRLPRQRCTNAFLSFAVKC